jgi:hypothetical protein
MRITRPGTRDHPSGTLSVNSRTPTGRVVYGSAMTIAGPKDLHESTLCVRCRYDLIGLEFDGLCPECGLPIEASRWRWATGSPWNLERTVASLGPTWLALLRRPFESVLRIWLTDRYTLRLLVQTSGVVAITPAALLWPISFVMGATAGWFMLVMAALIGVFLWPIIFSFEAEFGKLFTRNIADFDSRSGQNLAAHLAILLVPASLAATLTFLPIALSLALVFADTPPPPDFMMNSIYFGANLFVVWVFVGVVYPAAIYFAAKHRARAARARA